MKSLDTSVLVRYYTADDAALYKAAVAQLTKEPMLFVPKSVVQELWWALTKTKKYEFSPEKVNRVITHLEGLRNIVIEDAEAVTAALVAQRDGMDFPDALHLASSGGCTEMLTFDAGFAKTAKRLNLKPPCVIPS